MCENIQRVMLLCFARRTFVVGHKVMPRKTSVSGGPGDSRHRHAPCVSMQAKPRRHVETNDLCIQNLSSQTTIQNAPRLRLRPNRDYTTSREKHSRHFARELRHSLGVSPLVVVPNVYLREDAHMRKGWRGAVFRTLRERDK